MHLQRTDEIERAADVRGYLKLATFGYALPLILAFSYIDAIYYPQHLTYFLKIRVVTAVVVLTVQRLARSNCLGVMEAWLVFYFGVVVWQIHLVLFEIAEPAGPYYAGLLMVVAGVATELGSRWRCYAFNFAQVFVPYVALTLYRGLGPHTWPFLLNLIFMGSVATITGVGRWYARALQDRERQLRRQLQYEVRERDRIIQAKTEEALEWQAKRMRLDEEVTRANERMLITEQVAHDIRSPLSALNLIVAHAAGLSAEYRDLTRDAVVRISAIADDLLLRAKRDRRRVADHETPSLAALIELIVAEKRVRHGEVVGLSVKVGTPAYADVDATEFQRALSNLIENAIEASPVGGVVRIGLDAAGGAAEVRVTDEGRGIAADVVPRLGQRGLSVGKAGGTGLGLHQARAFASASGGELVIESEVGRGTIVTLRLPALDLPVA